MAAFNRTLTVDKGASYDKRFIWKTGETKETAVPVILTGCTGHTVVKDSSGNTLLMLTTEDGGLALGGVTGTVDYYITDAQTDALTVRAAKYQTEITFPGGRVRRFMEGQFVVNGGIE